MSAKAIREFDGKHLLSYWLPKSYEALGGASGLSTAFLPPTLLASVSVDLGLHGQALKDSLASAFRALETDHPWLKTTRLVCKPDQLIKRRGKAGLLGINLDWTKVKEWIAARAGTTIKVVLLF